MMKKLRIIYIFVIAILLILRLTLYGANLLNVYNTAEQTRKFSITARICTNVNKTDKNYTAYAKVLKIKPEININKISVVIPKSKADNLKYGDTISFVTKLSVPDTELNDGGFSYRKYLASQNVALTANLADKANKNTKVYEEKGSLNPFVKLGIKINRLQNACINHLDKYFKGDELGLIKAIITGDRDSISDEMKNSYINSGTYHIVAVSGLHTSVLICFFAFPLIMFNMPGGKKRKVRGIIAILTALFLLMFTGYGISVYKVLFMSIVMLIAVFGMQKYNALHALFYSLILTVIFMPYKIFDAGLWLSVSSTFGILLTGRAKKYIIKHFPKLLKGNKYDALLSSCLSTVTSLPFCIYYFSKTALVAPLCNLLVIPLASALVICSAIFSILGFLPHSICDVISYIPKFFAFIINTITKYAAQIPYSSIYVPYLTFFALLFSLILAIAIFIALKHNKKLTVYLLTTLTIIISITAMGFTAINNNRMYINVLNAENGSASIVTVKSGFNTKHYMFDCGSTSIADMATDVTMPYMSAKGISKIDTLFISYTGDECANSVDELINNIKVKNIVVYNSDGLNNVYADINYSKIIKNAVKKKIPIKHINSDDVLTFKDFTVSIINPEKMYRFKADNASAIYKINYGKTSALMCGGAGLIELNSISKTKNASCDMAVIMHSKYSKAITNFLDTAKPEYITLSTGTNAHEKLTDYFKGKNINYTQTLYDKTVTYESDGKNLILKK